MFNNLIESSSHRRELKRRGSFFLFTVATYALLFVITGVASIYAYDARMEDQSLELVMLTPVDFPLEPTVPTAEHSNSTSSSRNGRSFAERQIVMARVDRPVIPDGISTGPNKNLPLPDGPYFITGRDRDAELTGTRIGGNGSGGIPTTTPTTIDIVTPPPPPEQKPKPPVISKGPIASEALELPKPHYPAMAKQMRLQDKVSVQVLIDEAGKVISAKAIDGHPIFRRVCEEAAYRARFSPTWLGNQAVKVSGVITYNFELR